MVFSNSYLIYVKTICDGTGASATVPVNLNHVADMVQKQRTAPINEFEISRDQTGDAWHVTGAGLERFIQMTNWRYVTLQ